MEPTQFPNVLPAPFMLAQVPGRFLGRSIDPNLPSVGGYSREDLERMRHALARSGTDPAMLARIDEVIAMRRVGEPPLMLRPTSNKVKRVAPSQPSASYNPFGVLSNVLAQPQ